MKNGKEIIEGLNFALNREVSTALRYILEAASIQGAENQIIRDTYLSEVQDEVGHAQYLANKIVMLGGTPKLEPDLTPPPTDVPQMLENDIAEEKKDVDHYLKMAELAGKESLADLKVAMEDQAADEARHGEEMSRLMG